jgi:hypothetical protein
MRAECATTGEALRWSLSAIAALGCLAACATNETKRSSAEPSSSNVIHRASAEPSTSANVPGDDPSTRRAVIETAFPSLNENMKIMTSIAPACEVGERSEATDHSISVRIPSVGDDDLRERFANTATKLNLAVHTVAGGVLTAEDEQTHWTVSVSPGFIFAQHIDPPEHGKYTRESALQIVAEHQLLGSNLITGYELDSFKVDFSRGADGSELLEVDVFAQPTDGDRIEGWAQSLGLQSIPPRTSKWGRESFLVWSQNNRADGVELELSRPFPKYARFVLTQRRRGRPSNPAFCLSHSDHLPKHDLNPYSFLCSKGGFTGNSIVKCDASKEYCLGPPPCCDAIGSCVRHAPCAGNERVSCACITFDPVAYRCVDTNGGAALEPVLPPKG